MVQGLTGERALLLSRPLSWPRLNHHFTQTAVPGPGAGGGLFLRWHSMLWKSVLVLAWEAFEWMDFHSSTALRKERGNTCQVLAFPADPLRMLSHCFELFINTQQKPFCCLDGSLGIPCHSHPLLRWMEKNQLSRYFILEFQKLNYITTYNETAPLPVPICVLQAPRG